MHRRPGFIVCLSLLLGVAGGGCVYDWQWLPADGAPPVDAGWDARVDAAVVDGGPDASLRRDPVSCVVGGTDCTGGESCYRDPSVVDGPGACSQACTLATQATDCIQPATGTAVSTCGSGGWCELTCEAAEICPDGMTCDAIHVSGTLYVHRCQFH